ncbi:hypothetical protein [Demequina sp.]|uniref:hypothetical protein n=1 Tax=Demequina sp. TaxID=2050685 RepID=UPI003D14BD55
MKARTRVAIATACAVGLLGAGGSSNAADGGYIDGTDGCTAYWITTEHSAKTGKTSFDPCDSHAVRGKFQGNSGAAQWSKWVVKTGDASVSSTYCRVDSDHIAYG